MARAIDHDARRLQIAGAVWRLAAQKGLEAVTMRQVATEAGVSTRLVQYYFGSRDDLLAASLRYRRDHDRARIRARAPHGASSRAALRELLLAMLPIDDEGSMMYLVNVAYFVRSLNDPAIVQLLDNEDGPSLGETFLTRLRAANKAGELRAGLDLKLEAERLLALQDGMSSRLLLKMRTKLQAQRLIDYHLNTLFLH